MRRTARALLFVLLTCAAPCAAKKLALVIGIAGYPSFPEGEKLKYAGKDAEAFAAFIESEQGGKFAPGNVHLVTNAEAKRDRFYDEFDWLYRTAGPEDLVYVFFAGHGVEYQNVLYFLPYEALKENPKKAGIPMSEFFNSVTRDLSAKQVVVFIDACHAAGAAEGGRDRAAVDVQKEWDALNSKQGQFSMALFSSLANQRSWEDPGLGGGHGLFTWYVLEGLKGGAPGNGEGLITADALWNYVREKVEDRSRKRFPELQTPLASPSFRTDFFMARSAGKATAQMQDDSARVEATTAGTVKHHAKDEQNYVWIPAGSFMMGCSPGDGECLEDEKPAHAVTISNGFWLGQTTVTVEAWQRYRLATKSAELPRDDKYGREINEAAGGKNLPAVSMTWDEASAFCRWAGGCRRKRNGSMRREREARKAATEIWMLSRGTAITAGMRGLTARPCGLQTPTGTTTTRSFLRTALARIR